jgi:anthranilate synthase component II
MLKKQKILLIDNYDSFTYNLQHYLEFLNDDCCDVIRNDEIDLSAIARYDSLVLSPGPGLPPEAGNLIALIKEYYRSKKILGVCLGHQALGMVTGAQLKSLEKVLHGRQMRCIKTDISDPILNGIYPDFFAGRYHSWVIDRSTLSSEWDITSVDEDSEIMSMHHSQFPVWGVQFHPESIMTKQGMILIKNWLKE